MSGNGTNGASLPVVLAASMPRPSLQRTAPEAAFLSQLIAARHHFAPQRAKRRVPIAQAVDAYRIGGGVTLVRMPAGYRKTVLA